MFIARTDKFEYLGYKNNYHQFKVKGIKNSSLTLVTEAKIIDVETDIVFMLKEDGKIEPSYATLRKHDKEEITDTFDKLFVKNNLIKQWDLIIILANIGGINRDSSKMHSED